MAIFAVTFRVTDLDTPIGSYRARWESVNEMIRAHATTAYWHESTCFYLFDADLSASELAQSINDAALYDRTHDLILCIDLSTHSYAVIGRCDDMDLHGLMRHR